MRPDQSPKANAALEELADRAVHRANAKAARMIPDDVEEANQIPSLLNELLERVARLENESTGGGITEITHPFKITDLSDGSGAKVKCQFGAVNSVDVTLDDGSTLLSSDPAIDLSGPGTWNIFIALAVINDETIEVPDDDYCWVVAHTSAMPADTDIIGYILVGQVDVVAGSGGDPDSVSEIRQAVTHSLRHSICGRVARDDEASVAFVPGNHEFWGV